MNMPTYTTVGEAFDGSEEFLYVGPDAFEATDIAHQDFSDRFEATAVYEDNQFVFDHTQG